MHGLTVKGRREENQDAILHFQPSADTYFLAVADGMGGAAGGRVASSEVLNLASLYMQDEFGHTQHPKDLKGVLAELYRRAHQLIREKAQLDPSLEGLGTTLACVLAQGNQFVVANLGDSRTYLLRAGQLYQCSIDHTYISELQKERPGEPIDPHFVSAYGHIVTKTLDGGGEAPDLFPPEHPAFALAEGDLLVLCSDGLITDKGAGPQLLSHQLQNVNNLQEAAENLVTQALEAGSMDNISIVLARVDTVPAPTEHIAPDAQSEAAYQKGSTEEILVSEEFLSDAETSLESVEKPEAESSTTETYEVPDDFHLRKPSYNRTTLWAALGIVAALALGYWAYSSGLFSSDDTLQTGNILSGSIPTFSFDDTLFIAQPRTTFMLARDSLMAETVVMLPVTGTEVPLQQLTELPPGTYFWRMKVEADDTETLGPIHPLELVDGKR